MAIAYYFSFTQIRVDPEKPGFRWNLSDEGRARTIAALKGDWLSRINRIVTPDETRALETAEIFARHLKLQVEIDTGLRDIGRPMDEFLPVAAFQAALAALFVHPTESARPGWEPARVAQARLALAFEAQLARQEARSDALFVGHGVAGTLLLCHFGGQPLSQDCFEPIGGGNLFAIDSRSREVLFRWRHAAPLS